MGDGGYFPLLRGKSVSEANRMRVLECPWHAKEDKTARLPGSDYEGPQSTLTSILSLKRERKIGPNFPFRTRLP